MYYSENLIGQLYVGLEEFDNFNFLRVVPDGEHNFYRCAEKLENLTSLGDDDVYELGNLYTDAFEVGGVKGFLAGIYFALKLSEKYKEDFEKIKEFIDSFEDWVVGMDTKHFLILKHTI